MELLKFSLLNINEDLPSKYEVSPILLNIAHIVSIKPINIVIAGTVVKGHWIRLTNGKKYKIVDLPTKVKDLFEDSVEEGVVVAPLGNRSVDSEFLVQ